MEALEDFLEPERDESFRVTDKASADWSLRKLAKARATIQANVEYANEQVARIGAWVEEVNAPLEKDIAYFESLLVEYHRHLLTDDPQAKTVKLPNGTLKARKAPDRLEVDDESFLAWARASAPNLIRVLEAPDKAALKKLLVPDAPDGKAIDKETGEVIPGVAIERGEVRHSVDTP